eukprot:jgi/Mesvir1/9814/Mv25532-RA.1
MDNENESNAILTVRGYPGLFVVDFPFQWSWEHVEKSLRSPTLFDILAPKHNLPYRGRGVGVYVSNDSRKEKNVTASMITGMDVESDMMFVKTEDSDDAPTRTVRFTSEDVVSMLRLSPPLWVDAVCGQVQVGEVPACRGCGKKFKVLPSDTNTCECTY